MKTKVKFSELRHLLEGLGFAFRQQPDRMVFEHTPSDTLIVLRKYRANEAVQATNLAVVSTMLDHRGLMEAGQFEKALTKAAV